MNHTETTLISTYWIGDQPVTEYRCLTTGMTRQYRSHARRLRTHEELLCEALDEWGFSHLGTYSLRGRRAAGGRLWRVLLVPQGESARALMHWAD